MRGVVYLLAALLYINEHILQKGAIWTRVPTDEAEI